MLLLCLYIRMSTQTSPGWPYTENYTIDDISDSICRQVLRSTTTALPASSPAPVPRGTFHMYPQASLLLLGAGHAPTGGLINRSERPPFHPFRVLHLFARAVITAITKYHKQVSPTEIRPIVLEATRMKMSAGLVPSEGCEGRI